MAEVTAHVEMETKTVAELLALDIYSNRVSHFKQTYLIRRVGEASIALVVDLAILLCNVVVGYPFFLLGYID